nr:uncharacterized protein LOC109414919 isoform X2 [Aedes albopictus]
MGHLICLLVLSSLCLSEFVSLQATYQCGIRKHGFLPLIGKGWPVEEGHWQWHTAVFHRLNADDPFKYGCGGTLINERHALTAAHCAVRLPSGLSRSSLPAVMYEIELHFGQHNLSKVTDNVVIRDVIKAHVHPEYAKHKNDIDMLVTRLPVEYSDAVIPICLDQNVDRDLRELEGQRGWITGWGRTENGTFSDVLQTTSLPVVSYRQCIKDDPVLFAPVLSENDFCAGNKNGTSPGPGDSGGGMYISDGDRWILRGIVSYGKIDNLKVGVNSDKYTVFVNVQPYLPWIKAIFAESEPRRDRGQKRISELECERFQSMAIKRRNGDCLNNRYRYNVILINSDEKPICNGVLVEESHVITTCSCVRIRNKGVVYRNAKVRIEAYGIVAISEMICHPKHVHHRKHYDLAVIKLNATVSLCNTLIPACLANNWTENLYDILVKTLFQTERIGSADHMSLYESDDNRIKPYEACKSLHQHAWFNRSDDQLGELCVNSSDRLMTTKYSKLVDRASSGALLQTFNRNSCRSTIVGLKVNTERAYVQPIPHGIEIYARISYHLDWIENIIWRSEEHIKLPILGLDDKCNSSQHRTQITGKEMSVAIFHRNPETNAFELTCSGALISVKHVLTTARCVVNQTTGGSLPENTFELHFGLNRLSERSVNEQVRYASEVHIHQNYSVHNLAISGWSTIVNGVPNVELKNIFLYINGKKPLAKSLFQSQKCSKAGLKLLPNQYCFHHANGINTSIADRGSGMRCLVNQSSILVGIVSSEVKGNDATSYTILLYVQPYIAWINGIMVTKNPKRVSEKECERFRSLTKKINGVCKNYWDSTFEYPPHIVTLYDDDQNFICLGVLVRENRILTSCQCIRENTLA